MRPGGLARRARPQPGARFTGHNRFPDGFEYEVTCVVTEADRPRACTWVVLDDSGDPARPSSLWRYRIDPLTGGGSKVRQRFPHGPGASYLRAAAANAPDRAAGIIAARRDGLRADISAALRAMKAAAESSHATGTGPRVVRIRAGLTACRFMPNPDFWTGSRRLHSAGDNKTQVTIEMPSAGWRPGT